jgi:hypothetical protein
MSKPRRSPEFDNYCRTLRCPVGHRHMRFVEGSGEIVSDLNLKDRILLENPFTRHEQQIDKAMGVLRRLRQFNHNLHRAVAIERFRDDSAIECAECACRWPVFLPQYRHVEFLRPVGETHRIMTALGTDVRMIGHPEWITETSITTEFEKKWTQRLEVAWERGSVTEASSSVDVSGSIGGVELTTGTRQRIEETLKSHWSLVSEEQRTSKQSVSTVIPAGVIAKIFFTWKQVWEETRCEVAIDDEKLTLPYRVAVDTAFDCRIERCN